MARAKAKQQPPDGDEAPAQAPKAQPPPPPQKRKRAAPVSTASTLQTKTLYASTRDELREIQMELEELAQERRKLIEADTMGFKAILPLLPPSDKKS